jgi:hypothetical protein
MSDAAKNASLRRFRSRLSALLTVDHSAMEDALEALRQEHPHTLTWVDPLALGARLREFNCYALAFRLVFADGFFERRTFRIPAAIDMPLVRELLRRTREIDVSHAKRLDLVVYGDHENICHAGVVVEVEPVLTVRSKWGNTSILDHAPLDVPLEYGWSIRYFAALPVTIAWDLFVQHHERTIRQIEKVRNEIHGETPGDE